MRATNPSASGRVFLARRRRFCGQIDAKSGARCTQMPRHGARHRDGSDPGCPIEWGGYELRGSSDESGTSHESDL